jgi:23S rRNA (cytidine1920-2'-O)/16S rRNA (cytidine1409-2'-O)-methyltransferase
MKERLDVVLHEQGFYESREKAKAAIMAGIVIVDGARIDKPGTKIEVNSSIIIKGDTNPYVSRGGLKLEKALLEYNVDITGKTCMDVGCSTGGFTDALLKFGASKVYGIDVGYGQLDWKLRNDPRVVLLERTNFRYLEKEKIPETIDFITVDVSFISTTKLMDKIDSFLSTAGSCVFLVKPQFEAGPELVGKKGVVKSPKIHLMVIESIITAITNHNMWVYGITYSPIKGPEGNIEFLLYTGRENKKTVFILEDIINQAHGVLKP